ncbi:phage protein GemA/Gp16 family protein [Zavarzinia sp.]|uniref:phage protein GemA/Gp16 family protein n=1 Tax=Zavarzinia sp. TaxID=2027920 RepID=UPI003BB66FFF
MAAPDPAKRRSLIAAIHAEAKKQGMDDDLRRQVIANATGKKSAADLTLPELGKALDAIKGRAGARQQPARGRALAESDHARKIRALWLSLWNLGAVDSPSEAAIAAFAKRQLRIEALQWVTPHQASSIIEALRDMGRRHGWDVKPGCTVDEAETALVTAQFEQLVAVQDATIQEELTRIVCQDRISRREVIRRYGNLIRAHKGGARG